MCIPSGDHQADNNNEQSRSTIILENEILLMKLNAEFGAQIFLPEQRIDPEIENHFLRSVYNFEKNAASGRELQTIYKIIGEPVYPDETIMDEEQVSKKLDALLDLLYQHKIVLDTLVEYPDRALYRFITTEFFQVEIDLPGGTDCYMHLCYEDFYPNHDYDLRQATRYFVNFIIDDLSLVPQNGLYTRVRTSSGLLIGYKEATTVIRASRTEFSSLNLHQLNIREVLILDDVAFVGFEVEYTGLLPDGGTIEVKGEGQLEFVYSDELWWISFLKFPGIVI
ncbi:hypothetical protein [Flavitalea sp.]|nr:hypothetical protein [Flavitalea sp.]